MARLIDQVGGHQTVWQLLIEQKRRGSLPHAMVFTGPSGIGKKKLAWAFAQTLLCQGDVPPCGECGACRRVENQQSESVLYLEPQSGSLKLEAAHKVSEFLSLQRLGRARLILIDSAQSLNPQAANALLKAIEEPPPETFFILIVSEVSQLLPTLRSRLQVVRFAPLAREFLAAGRDVPEWTLHSARGSFEQLESFLNEESGKLRLLALGLLTESLRGRRGGLEQVMGELKDKEAVGQILRFLQELLRDWTVNGVSAPIHGDLQDELASLPAVEVPRRVDLWRHAFQMETDFAAHVDRGLLFDNFFYRTKALVG